jgi:predicted small lipoprotein YifL
MKKLPRLLAAICGLLGLAGCGTYLPPGAKADLQAFASADIQAAFATKPTNPFPASIAGVRVQAPNYTNHDLQKNGGLHGSGRYSIIMARDAEEPAQFERIQKLPGVAGTVALNRLLLPQNLGSDREIREAAARLHADLVFLYTFDTAFFDVDAAKPLTVITLGAAPTRKISVVATLSGLLLDTRTGFVYAAYEVTEKAATVASSWGSADAADEVRRQTERKAFGKLVDEVETSWPKILREAAKSGAPSP